MSVIKIDIVIQVAWWRMKKAQPDFINVHLNDALL